MSYRCNICDRIVPEGPMVRWPTYRADRSIQSETPCCRECHRQLSAGSTLYDLLRSAAQHKANPPLQVEEVLARPTVPPQPVAPSLLNLAVSNGGKLVLTAPAPAKKRAKPGTTAKKRTVQKPK